MPELPEVETVRRGLSNLLANKHIDQIEILLAKAWIGQAESLIGSGFTTVRRRGKMLLLDLDNALTLAIHLRMTGQLVYVADAGERFGAGHPSDSLVDTLPDRSTRVIFTLNGAKLYFNDQRTFGRIEVLATAAVENLDFLQRLGPEPLSADFNALTLANCLHKVAGRAIKAALLDQSVIAGIGNIYADEALWGAKIHPERLVRSLSDSEISLLCQAIRAVLQLSIDQGGSTDRNYVDAEGKRGAYLDFAKVYHRKGLACQRCGTAISKLRVAGRGTHICPKCQI